MGGFSLPDSILDRYEVFTGYWGLILFAASLALQYLFPQKIQGPRADNLKISTARYGAVLARVHGRARVAGHAIWLEGGQVVEHATTRRVGGGGILGLFGGGPKVTEYHYTSTFAVAFTSHEVAAVTRLWFDGLLIYDNRAEALTAAVAGTGTLFGGNNLHFRLYRGTADQRPDARLAADVGANAAEAYPGTSYIVVQDWNHEDTGIRLPDVEAEVVTEAEDTFNLGAFTGSSTRTDTENDSDYDPERQLMGHLDSATGVLEVWRAQDRALLYSIDLRERDGYIGTFARGLLFDGEGHLFTVDGGTLRIYDAYTGALLLNVGGVFPDSVSLVHRAIGLDADTGVRTLYFYQVTTGISVTRDPLTADWVVQSLGLVAGNSTTAVTAMTADAGNRIWLSGNLNADVATLWEAGPFVGAGAAVTTEHDLSGIVDGSIAGVAYIPEDDSLILADGINGDVGRLIKVPADDPTTVLATYDVRISANRKNAWSRRGYMLQPEFAIVDEDGFDVTARVHLIDAVTMTAIETWLRSNWGAALDESDDWIYDPVLRSIAGFSTTIIATQRRHFYLPRVPDGRISRAQIIRDECLSVGITPDVSQVTGEEIGYAVRDDAPPRTVLEDLMRVRAIDAAQIDGALTFWDKRTQSARTLEIEALGAAQGEPGQSVVKEEPGDPFDLPAGIVLEYLAYDAQYRRGAQRVGMPEGFEVAGADLKFESSLVLQDDDAAQAADLILQEARDIRQRYSTGLLPAQLDLHPGEVVTLPLDEDRSAVAVLTEITQDMIIQARFHRRSYDYASDAVGAPTPDAGPAQIDLARARFLPLDIPILDDAADDAAFYWALHTVGFGSFVSASLYRSVDEGQTWAFYDSVKDAAKVAVAASAMPEHKPWRTDRTNTLQVHAVSGGAPAASTTHALARNGTNSFAIKAGDDWEIVNVVTVTDLGGGLYEFSGIIRGRDGTDSFTGDHAIGDLVVRLDDDALQRSLDTASKDVAALWIARTLGIPLDDSVATAFTNEAKGTRPRAPHPVSGVRDMAGDLDIAWRRCTRLQHGWLDGDAPLGETTEAYAVEIYEDAALLRTITGLTTPAATYTLAQYQSDAGGSPAPSEIPPVEVRVYQISSSFGRGLPGIKTL